MTREKAIEIILNGRGSAGPEYWVNVFTDLGMLKLDEEPSANCQASYVLNNLPTGANPYQILTALHKAGLKIVNQ